MSARPRMICLAVLIAALCLSSVARGKLDTVMDHEPVEHLKAHFPKTGDEKSGKLGRFLQLPPNEMTRKTAQIEKNLRNVLKKQPHVSAFFLKRTTVLAKRTAAGIQFNSTFLLPHGILLPILSTSLTILLEGYKGALIYNTMGGVLKGTDRGHPDVRSFQALSLHDLVTKLPPKSGVEYSDNPSLLSDLNKRGKAARYFVNAILEEVAEDAWRDALISVAMDNSAFAENGQMLTSFKDLGMYADTLSSDLINFFEVAKSDVYQLDEGHYLYGWWFNCPRSSKDSTCLAPFLPSDCVAILNPAIRIYSFPRLNLHLIVGNSGSAGTHTLAEVLHQDKLIWNTLYSVVDPDAAEPSQPQQDKDKEAKADTIKVGEAHTVSPTPKETVAKHTSSAQEDEIIGESTVKPKTVASKNGSPKSSSGTNKREEDVVVEEIAREKKDGQQSLLIRAIHMSWPVTVFLFYTVFSHVWVYWVIHLLWLVCSSLFSGIHLPRPKTAKQE